MRRFALRPALVFGLLTTLAACGSGGSGQPPIPTTSASATPTQSPSGPPTATPTPPGASSVTIVTQPGNVSGAPNGFVPAVGDTASGGQGQAVDGKICDPAHYENYHVHFFLGLWVNGTQIAIPPALGMFNLGPPVAGFYDAASCVYYVHTHDSSGIIHIEDPDSTNLPITQSIYTLKQLFDEWGIAVNANEFGPFSGPVRVFTSGPMYRGGAANQTTPATDLTFYGTDANSVPAYSYEVIDVEVGPTYPSTLPNVRFYEAH